MMAHEQVKEWKIHKYLARIFFVTTSFIRYKEYFRELIKRQHLAERNQKIEDN